jgi:hypothetical protein
MKNYRLYLVAISALQAGICTFGQVKAQQNEPVNIASGQTQTSETTSYKDYPMWKDMINDPHANFFEVQKAFQVFWEGKSLPTDEDDIIGEKRKLKNNLINRTFNAGELKEQAEREALAFDCRKYRWWLIKTEPFIHDDGSIMSDEEQLELWKNHYEELNEQNKK